MSGTLSLATVRAVLSFTDGDTDNVMTIKMLWLNVSLLVCCLLICYSLCLYVKEGQIKHTRTHTHTKKCVTVTIYYYHCTGTVLHIRVLIL